MKRAVVLVACCVAALGPAARAQSRVAFAEYEFVGPSRRVVLDAGPAGSTVVDGALAAGETRRAVVPVPTWPGAPPLEPRVVAGPDSSGSARFLGWRPKDARFEALPAALRARPAPLASSVRVRADVATLCVLAAAGVVGLWLLRKPRAAIALGIAASAGGSASARSALTRDAVPVEVLDGLEGESDWRRARAARDSIALPSRGATYDVSTEPVRAPLALEAPLDPSAPARASSRGAVIVATWSEPWDARAFERAANAFAPLASAWLREDGNWSAHGAWPLAAALGPAVEGHAPPGWLVSGLPQGLSIVVGELEPAAGRPARAYVRWTFRP